MKRTGIGSKAAGAQAHLAPSTSNVRWHALTWESVFGVIRDVQARVKINMIRASSLPFCAIE